MAYVRPLSKKLGATPRHSSSSPFFTERFEKIPQDPSDIFVKIPLARTKGRSSFTHARTQTGSSKLCAHSEQILQPEAVSSATWTRRCTRPADDAVHVVSPPSPWTVLLFFFTLVTGPRMPLSLKLSDTRVYEPQIRHLTLQWQSMGDKINTEKTWLSEGRRSASLCSPRLPVTL